jgi:hypothetical protein
MLGHDACERALEDQIRLTAAASIQLELRPKPAGLQRQRLEEGFFDREQHGDLPPGITRTECLFEFASRKQHAGLAQAVSAGQLGHELQIMPEANDSEDRFHDQQRTSVGGTDQAIFVRGDFKLQLCRIR